MKDLSGGESWEGIGLYSRRLKLVGATAYNTLIVYRPDELLVSTLLLIPPILAYYRTSPIRIELNFASVRGRTVQLEGHCGRLVRVSLGICEIS